jgi:selenocysteine lyase/cysteine desulfurase
MSEQTPMPDKLDLAFVRQQFPAFTEPSLDGYAYFENAGGSYICKQVIERLTHFYSAAKMQPYGLTPVSAAAGEDMDAAHTRLASYLNVSEQEVHLGPSTSQNTYVLANAVQRILKPGDEIIVTQQDHEANSGCWRRLAGRGFTIREWQVDPLSGQLELSQLDALLTENTALVAFPHCSNIVAFINPVKEIMQRVHAAGAIGIVDGVSYAGHGFPDLGDLDVDIYLFSLYKTYGPHQGVLFAKEALAERLGNEGHYFNAGHVHKQLVPAGPDHGQVIATNGVLDYFDLVHAHHFEPTEETAIQARQVHDLFRSAEKKRLTPLLDYLTQHAGVRLLGSDNPEERAPTVAFLPLKQSTATVLQTLHKKKIIAGADHFYAARLVKAMGIDTEQGVMRCSFVHYTSESEMNQLLEALDVALV